MAGTVSSANEPISEDAPTEDIGRPINAHMTVRREIVAMPNVITADVTMPIVTNDNPLAGAHVEEWMRVGRKGDEEQDGNVKALVTRRLSERLKARDRTTTVGCSELRATQKISPISRSFSEGAAGTGEAFFDDSPAVNENEEATDLLQTLTDAPPQSSLEELAIMFMTLANNRFGDDLNLDDATRLLRDNHCNVDDALEAYGRHQAKFRRAVITPELPNNASSAQSTPETGVRGATGLQRRRLSPKLVKKPVKTETIRESVPTVKWASLSKMQLRMHEKSERFSACKHYEEHVTEPSAGTHVLLRTPPRRRRGHAARFRLLDPLAVAAGKK